MRISWTLMGKPLADLEREAGWCEESGLDGVWYPDYQGPAGAEASYPDLAVALTLLARGTSRVFVGSLVTDVLRRHPMVVAQLFATLSHLAPGRVILGLGAGGGTSHVPFGIPLAAPARRLREGIAVIRALWTATEGHPASYVGRHFSLRDASLPIRPRAPVPIYVAAFGPRMLALTGAVADGWVPEGHTPATFRGALAAVQDAQRSSGRPRGCEPCLALLFHPFRPSADRRSPLLRAAKVMLAFNVDILRRLRPGLLPEDVRSVDLARQPDLWRKIQDRIPDDVAAQTALLGSREACRSRLLEYAQAGCRHVVLEPYWGMTPSELNDAVEAAAMIRTDLQQVKV